MNKLSVFLLIAGCCISAQADLPVAAIGGSLFSQCPVVAPMLAPDVQATSKVDSSGNTSFSYVFHNGTTATDFVNTVTLMGVGKYNGTGAPSDWMPIESVSSVTWWPTTILQDGKSYLSTNLPSSSDIAPGGSEGGFTIASSAPKGLVMFWAGARRNIDTEVAAFETWRNQLPAPMSASPTMALAQAADPDAEADADGEAFSEVYSDACGSNLGYNPMNMVFGVTDGPSGIPVVNVSAVPAVAVAGTPSLPIFKAGGVSPGAGTLGQATDAVLINPETMTHIPISVGQYLPVDTNGFPSLTVTIPLEAISKFSCRTAATLIEFRSSGKVISRGKIQGKDLGLPAQCSR